MSALDELEKLAKKPPVDADSAEGKARSQIANRLVLEMLYSGALGNLQPQKRNGVVYRSDDQGETWKGMTEYKLSGGSSQVNQTEGGYYGRIIIDPNDDKVLYCGDTNTTVSRDSGKTFAATGWDGNGKTHVDHRVVWVDPLNSNHILSGNDGGVSESVGRRQALEPEERASARSSSTTCRWTTSSPTTSWAARRTTARGSGRRRTATATGCSRPTGSTCPPATASTSSATGGTPSTSTTRASSARRAGRT